MTPNQLREILTQHVLWLDSDGFQGRRANLPGMSLTRADLSAVNLAGANLFEAELRGANLTWANLWGADLRGANLSGADLTGAHLDGAELREADLRGADLDGADLRTANLTGAQLGPEIRECFTFAHAKVSEDQLAWLCLHPKFSEWVDGLEIGVKQ